MQKTKTYNVEVLLIDNIPESIAVLTQILNATKFEYQLHFTNNERDAIDFLRKESDYKNKPKPDLIFLGTHPSSINKAQIFNELDSNKSYLYIPVLYLNLAKNKIEAARVFHPQLIDQLPKEMDIKYFMETIVSLKKFLGSLNKFSDQEKN
ncbi:hypothetical protein ACFLRY_02655 [Bacteroidota bacterium]